MPTANSRSPPSSLISRGGSMRQRQVNNRSGATRDWFRLEVGSVLIRAGKNGIIAKLSKGAAGKSSRPPLLRALRTLLLATLMIVAGCSRGCNTSTVKKVASTLVELLTKNHAGNSKLSEPRN